MMIERGVAVDHTTIYRWVQAYNSELDERCCRYLRPSNNSWRVDETHFRANRSDQYLYRFVDSAGNILDFMLRAKQDAQVAQRFFRKVLKASHTIKLRVITIDKNKAYPVAIRALKTGKALFQSTTPRQCKCLNNIVEQDHRFIKRCIKPGFSFSSSPHSLADAPRL